jgi:DNA polymerase-1
MEPLAAELRKRQLWSLFAEVEMPLVPVLTSMERAGVKLDLDYLHDMSKELARRLDELKTGIYDIVGHSFNIGSTQQLSDALFVTLGLPTKGMRKTKSGHYSTAADVLERLKGAHPAIDLILEQRELSKLQTTYVDALPQLVNPATGRVHTSFKQTGTVTGRISSRNPNLQNIPVRTEQGRQVRRAFVAKEGCLLLAADYSQVELRVLAHISQDPGLLEAFRQGEDIHRTTAAAVYNVPPAEVTYDRRRVAKTANFAMIYGSSAYGLAQQTGLTPDEAAQFMETYFARFPAVQAYIQATKEQAAQKGYVETLLGRRRYFPELARGSKARTGQRRAAERMAINAPIQGSAADIIKIAMIRLHQALRDRKLRSRMILQVHDELVLEVPEEEVDAVSPLVAEIMEGAFALDAPLKVDMKVGPNWLEMERV